MQREWRTLLEVLTILNAQSLPYMLTGSIAKSFYSDPRMTRDIDIVIEMGSADAVSMVRLFEKSFYIDEVMVREAVANSSMFNIMHNELQVKVDFIIRKDSDYRKVEFDRRKSFALSGVEAWVVSPEDLILSKLDWAKDSLSEMQLSDVKDLLRSVKTLDMDYLEKWISHLGLAEIFERVKS